MSTPTRWKANSFDINQYTQSQAQQQHSAQCQIPPHSSLHYQSQYGLSQYGPQRHSEPYHIYGNQPRLVRASSLSPAIAESLLNVKVIVDFNGDIGTMTENWTEEETKNSRRLVYISAVQQFNHLTLSFKAVSQSDYVSGSPVVSCIYWKETGRYYLTSVDLILLLEHLVQDKFLVEEKNRIRRNLQSIKPITIAKIKPEYHDFFNLIMNFNNPRPRHIEKGVKVLYWDHLKEALSKVLSKYTVDPVVSVQQQPQLQSELPHYQSHSSARLNTDEEYFGTPNSSIDNQNQEELTPDHPSGPNSSQSIGSYHQHPAGEYTTSYPNITYSSGHIDGHHYHSYVPHSLENHQYQTTPYLAQLLPPPPLPLPQSGGYFYSSYPFNGDPQTSQQSFLPPQLFMHQQVGSSYLVQSLPSQQDMFVTGHVYETTADQKQLYQ